MSTRYDLTCEYIHCFGKHTLALGSVAIEEEAALWKEKQIRSGSGPSLPENDPIRVCPVIGCPLKRQVPRFDYQKITN
jgi:hypothetical protein